MLKRGDIVRLEFPDEPKTMDHWVVVAVAPDNGLHDDRVDIVRIEDVKTPLQTDGTGMPIKYIKKIGRLVG